MNFIDDELGNVDKVSLEVGIKRVFMNYLEESILIYDKKYNVN